MNKKKLLVTLCLFILTSLSAAPIHAANLHALLIGDTKDPSIGVSSGVDLANFRNELKKVSKYTALPLNLVILKGQSATLKNVIKQLDLLNPAPDDVVVLYFSLHGFRTPSKVDQWPNLCFGPSDNAADFHLLHSLALAKQPRLLISIADSCNNEIPDEYAPWTMIAAKSEDLVSKNSLKNNYKELFVNTRGSMIISGAIPGLYSWAYVSKGSVFTLAFLASLQKEVKKSDKPSWDSLLNYSLNLTQKKMQQADELQIPQYILDIY